MSDQPTDPRQQPQPNDPDAQPDAPAQATTPLNQPEPAKPAEQTAQEQQTGQQQTDETAAHGAEWHGAGASPPPPPAPPGPPVAARTPGGFGRFARHRATQIVAAGLAGLVIGGGVVALIDRDGPRGRDLYGYHGPSDRGPRGNGPYWEQRPYRDFRDGQRPPRQAPQPPPAPSTPSTPPTSSTG